MVRAIALAGGGIGLIPHRMCVDDVEKGRLVRVLPAWAATAVDFYYVISPRKRRPEGHDRISPGGRAK